MAPTRIGLVLGDPAGVGPEIAAKLLKRNWDRDDLRFIVIGTEAVLAGGARVAGIDLDLETIRQGAPIPQNTREPLLMTIDETDLDDIPEGKASRAAGLFALRSLQAAVEAAKARQIDAIVYAPLNKHAMSLAGFDEIDEMHYLARLFECRHFCSELNVLDKLWTVRATSHVPLGEVAGKLTTDLIIDATRLGVSTMARAGLSNPRVAVAGLNPHAGDGGTIGQEDIDIIQPAVEALKREGMNIRGPISPDTVMMVAYRGAFDLVVTMYHDQGQIALKALGFERVVTMLGGLPVPAITASSGSAYDITGQNLASPDGMLSACELARRLTEPVLV
ncbi:MAG: 4-hydroxythreonine-4-phosphate dehydrogenase PdxA [Bauldia sp.]|nr:4-hydroxythreonine-4-phosphate dehydrogenase PdxA [Bauldia sp.]